MTDSSSITNRTPLTLIDRALTFVCRTGVLLSFAVLIYAVLTQVVGRSILSDSPAWTEELTRYALLWLVAFGTGLSLKTGDLVNVDIISEALPGKGPWVLRFASAIITVGFCAALVTSAWRFTSIGAMQTSPVLKIPMNFIHMSVLGLLVLLGIFAAMRVVLMLTGASDGRANALPDIE
ncbi:TRAP transporter small permease [Fulvimarina sp. MAC8]|uniref:TRAP transporter small permease n=1 Tax=Fulvimarina sp. MAC8 TaxID=3162874 RepID=UPI0032EBF322